MKTRRPKPPLSVEEALDLIQDGFPRYVRMTAEELIAFRDMSLKGQRKLSEQEVNGFAAEAAANRTKGKVVNVTKRIFMRMVALSFSTFSAQAGKSTIARRAIKFDAKRPTWANVRGPTVLSTPSSACQASPALRLTTPSRFS